MFGQVFVVALLHCLSTGTPEEADAIIRPLEGEEMSAVRPRGAILIATEGIVAVQSGLCATTIELNRRNKNPFLGVFCSMQQVAVVTA